MADIVDLSVHQISLPPGAPPLYQVPNAGMAVIEDVINATWNKGLQQEASFAAKIDAIETQLDEADAPSITAPTEVSAPLVSAPLVDIPTTVDDYVELYRTQYLEMMEELSNRFQVFRETHFPDETAGFAAAQDWLLEAVANPDSALPQAIQDKIFEDERSRILDDASRAGDAVLSSFAARRFPLPPGQAAAAIAGIQQKAQAEIGASSRNMAKLAVEMQRFTVEKLLGLRQAADGAALEYIKALAVAPSESIKVTNQQSALIAAAADFYRADIAAAELTAKVGQFNNTLAVDVAGKNQAAELSIIGERIKALLAEAQAVAQMAGALFNNLNVSTSLSANGGSQLSGSSEY